MILKLNFEEAVEHVVDRLAKIQGNHTILLTGFPNNGKSHFMHAIFKKYKEKTGNNNIFGINDAEKIDNAPISLEEKKSHLILNTIPILHTYDGYSPETELQKQKLMQAGRKITEYYRIFIHNPRLTTLTPKQEQIIKQQFDLYVTNNNSTTKQ